MKGKKLTQKKRAKKMKGGSSENIAHTLLLNSIIPYLPTTETVKSESKVRDYLSAMDALTLLEIVGNDAKYMNSKSLNYLIDSIDRNTMELIETMGKSLKIPQLRKDIETFEIDCLKLAKKTNVKDLLELPNYLLDCNDELCNRNMNWYDIIMGFRKLDDDYEELVRKEIVQKKIIINTNKTLIARERLRKNNKVREIMKRRLLSCCSDPRSFFSKIKGTVAWVDYNQCTSCPSEECILYIDDNYRNFLMMNLGISSVKKLKILIFIEIRIHLLAKYLFIESLRLNSQRKRKVSKLVEKIYRNDAKNGRISTPKTKVENEIRGKMVGGAEDSLGSVTPGAGRDGIGGTENSSSYSTLGKREPLPGSTDFTPNRTSDGLSPSTSLFGSSPPPGGTDASPLGAGKGAPPPPGVGMDAPPPPGVGMDAPPLLPPAQPPSSAPTPPGLGAPTPPGLGAPPSNVPPSEAPGVPPSASGSQGPNQTVPQEPDDQDEELVIYLTYNKIKAVQNIDTLKRLIIDAMKRITHMNSSENIMIGNPDGTDKGYRSGVCTYSIEVTISRSQDPEETFEVVKKHIGDSILDGSLDNLLNVMDGSVSLRDIFFKGIENEISNKTNFKFKRGIAEIKEKYPTGGNEDKLKFATKIKTILYDAIKSKLISEQSESAKKKRLQLELISAVDDDDTVVLVQFMIMDSFSAIEEGYDLAKALATSIDTEKSSILNASLVDINMIDRCYTFDTETPCNASTKELGKSGVKPVGLQKDHIVVINNNCQEVVKNLRENYVSNAPLSANCEEVINKELGVSP